MAEKMMSPWPAFILSRIESNGVSMNLRSTPIFLHSACASS